MILCDNLYNVIGSRIYAKMMTKHWPTFILSRENFPII